MLAMLLTMLLLLTLRAAGEMALVPAHLLLVILLAVAAGALVRRCSRHHGIMQERREGAQVVGLGAAVVANLASVVVAAATGVAAGLSAEWTAQSVQGIPAGKVVVKVGRVGWPGSGAR